MFCQTGYSQLCGHFQPSVSFICFSLLDFSGLFPESVKCNWNTSRTCFIKYYVRNILDIFLQTGMSRITPHELSCQCFFRWESSLIKQFPLKAYTSTHSITKLPGWSMFLPWEPLPAQLARPRPMGAHATYPRKPAADGAPGEQTWWCHQSCWPMAGLSQDPQQCSLSKAHGSNSSLPAPLFLGEIRRNFFPERVGRHWNRLPREGVVSPSLEVFKNRIDIELSDMA